MVDGSASPLAYTRRLFHPWMHELRLSAPRQRETWWLLATASVIAILLMWRPALIEPVLVLCRQWPWLAPLLATLASYRLIRARLIGLRRQWQHGWWAALPISAGARRRTLLLVAALLALMVWLPVQGLLMLAGWSLPAAEPALMSSTLLLAAATVVGAAAGWLSALRAPSLQHETTRHQGRRDPLWSTRLLRDPRLPWLAEWQRRETTLRWRRGGSALPLGVALCLFPSGAAPPALLALLLFAMSLGWLGVALRSSASIAVQAMRLLQALPLQHATCLRSLGRYPLLCVLVASPPGLLLAGLALGGNGPLLWCVAALLLALPALLSVVHMLRSRTRA